MSIQIFVHFYLGYMSFCYWVSLVAQIVKNPLQFRRLRFYSWVGKIPWRREWQPTPVFLPGESTWTEEPGKLQSMGSQRIGHDWATKHTHMLGGGANSPLSYTYWKKSLFLILIQNDFFALKRYSLANEITGFAPTLMEVYNVPKNTAQCQALSRYTINTCWIDI